jgi:prepilin peptidase CpaA
VEQTFLICLSILLVIAAIGDLRSYTIPNWLSISIVALFILHTIFVPPGFRAISLHLAIAAAIFVGSTLLFIKGAFGGGDVKLLSSLALWVGLIDMPRLLLTMAIAGGILAIIVIIVRWHSKSTDRRLPYGVAIALAGLDYCLAQMHLALW